MAELNELTINGSNYTFEDDVARGLATAETNRAQEAEQSLQTAINNKVDKVTGKCLSTNDYTNDEKAKLAGLNNYDDTQVRQLIAQTNANFANYYTKTESYSAAEVDTLLRTQRQGQFVVANTLPAPSADTMFKIYLVPSTNPETQNVKDEFVTLESNGAYSWEQIGTTAVDLSGYSTTEEMNAAIATALASYYTKSEIDTALGTKQNIINDLSDIRSGAQAGSTAVQPSTLNSVVKNTVAESGVYDVSANNDNTKFESLSALLSSANLNTLIPTDIRKGGMSIKFVQSSDNKYVQYRLMLSSWSTDVDDWQSMNADKVPTVSKTWAELKAMRDGGTLAPGQWYRITDYVTTTAQAETQSAGHPFDIIVRADSASTLSETAYAARHDGDTYFQNAKLESWQLKYCLDNDSNRFAWSDSLGKGVVYGMIDEFGNECGYDFKNIQFKRYKVTSLSSNTSLEGLYAGYRVINTSGSQGSLYPSGGTVSTYDTVWRYTFDLSGADYSLSPRQNGCHGNNIAPCKLQDTIANRERQWLNNITFGNTQSSSQCWGNKFLERCHSMSFGNECYANTFGQSCSGNTFGQNCWNNTFGQYCYYNTFGQYCYCNTFGQNCSYNTFGQYCRYNTFGQNCWSNTFGQSCQYNTFGQNCYRNTFGQNCCENTFGQSCQYNTFGQYCHYNSIDHAYPLDGEYGTNEVPDSVRHCKLISYEFNYEDGEEYGVTAWLCSPFDATVNLIMYVTDSEGGTITSYNQQVTLKANVPQYFETRGSSDNDPSVFHAEMSYEIAGKTVTLEGEYEW